MDRKKKAVFKIIYDSCNFNGFVSIVYMLRKILLVRLVSLSCQTFEEPEETRYVKFMNTD